LSFIGGVRDDAGENGNAVTLKHVTGLIFVKIHG
jgi:hypothetical protein